jgi:hypothetical protein
MNTPNNEIAVFITSPNESLDRTVSLNDRDALKKLKKRVTNILNDAIDAVRDDDTNPEPAA